MLINVVLTPGKPIPKSNFRDGNWCELWVLLPPLSHWGPEPRENSFYRAREGKLAQETCAGCPQQRYATGEPSKLQSRNCVGIVEGACGYRTLSVSIRGKFDLSRNMGCKKRGSLKIVLTPGKLTPKSNFREGTQCELWILLGPEPDENSFYRTTRGRGEWAQETCAGFPQQRYATGEPGKLHNRDHGVIVVGSCGYRARGVSIRGKFVLSRNVGYKTRGGVTILLNVVLTTGKRYPKSNFRDGTQCELWILLPPLPLWGPVPQENSFYRARGGKWAQETCVGCPQWRYATGEPVKLQRRDRVEIVEGSCGYQVRGVSIRVKFVLWRNMGYKTRVVAMLLNIVLNPREAYPEVKLHGRDIVRVVGIVDPFAPIKGRYPEIIRFIEPQGGNGPS